MIDPLQRRVDMTQCILENRVYGGVAEFGVVRGGVILVVVRDPGNVVVDAVTKNQQCDSFT